MPEEEKKRRGRISAWSRKVKESGKTKNFLVFLVFVCIAAVFWLILSLNDDVQTGFDLTVKIDNVPDSVTFITPPPTKIHVMVRDKGGRLLQYAVNGKSELHLNFEEFESGDYFRVSKTSLLSSLRHLFGSNASISWVTPDSLSLLFTRQPGRKVPVELTYEATAVAGMVVLPDPQLSEKSVTLYSLNREDTIRRLFTEKVVLRNLDKTTTVDVPLAVVPGTRALPGNVKVTFTVEPLVRKESEVAVEVENLPSGRDILFFPSKVKVAYYVPMSLYNRESDGIKVVASFKDAQLSRSDKVGVRLEASAPYVSGAEVMADSVEYSLVSGK